MGSDREHASLLLFFKISTSFPISVRDPLQRHTALELAKLTLNRSVKWGKISPPDELHVVLLGLERAVLFMLLSVTRGT